MDQQHPSTPATGHPDMLARADEARRLFPELLPASPGMAPAAPEGQPALDDPGHDGTGEAGRSRPSWMQRLRFRMQSRRFAADAPEIV